MRDIVVMIIISVTVILAYRMHKKIREKNREMMAQILSLLIMIYEELKK